MLRQAAGGFIKQDKTSPHAQGPCYLEKPLLGVVKQAGRLIHDVAQAHGFKNFAGPGAQLVADLGSEDYATREAAGAALEGVGGEAIPVLREAVARSASAEVRKRANELIETAAAPAARPDELRAVRAVEVLEGLRTPGARALLEKWASGPKGRRTTAEAAAALARLKAADGE